VLTKRIEAIIGDLPPAQSNSQQGTIRAPRRYWVVRALLRSPIMRHLMHQTLPALCLAVLMATAAAAQNRSTSQPGDVVQSIPPPVSQNPQLPQLKLTNKQRARIKQVLSTKNTEVSFGLKTAKPAQSFDPTVGAQIPAALKPHALPPPLIYEMPTLKHYSYVKFKGQVLVINPMTRKIVDMFSET
jgi:hypothetical protein